MFDCGFSIGVEEFEGNFWGCSGGWGGLIFLEVNFSNFLIKVSLGNIILISVISFG